MLDDFIEANCACDNHRERRSNRRELPEDAYPLDGYSSSCRLWAKYSMDTSPSVLQHVYSNSKEIPAVLEP